MNTPRPPRLLASSLLGLAICLFLASARLRGLLFNSTLLTAGTLAVSLPLGTLLATLIVKTSLPGRKLIEGVMLALLFIPLYVHAAAWQAALGHGGWLNPKNSPIWFIGWTACIWVHGFAATAWVVLFVATALRNIRPELEEESLQDASPARVLRRVSLRGALSGILAAALWIAVICFGEIAVTDLYQVRTFAEEIYTAANLGVLADSMNVVPAGELTLENVPQLNFFDLWIGTGVVLALVLAALSAIWSWLPTTDATSTSQNWLWYMKSGRWVVMLMAVLILAVIVFMPIVSLLIKAGATTEQIDGNITRSWSATKSISMVFTSFWQHRREWGWSLAIGTTAVAMATSVAGLLAWALRTRYLPTLPVTLSLAFCLAVPGPLLAVWLIGIFNQPDDSFLWPLTWCYNHTILVPTLVQFLRALPVATLILWSQLANIPQDVLDSATSEGAGWWQQLWSIVLPSQWTSVIATVALALVVAVSELTATLLVAPPGVSTLPMRIFGLLHYGSEDRVSALCLALALAVATLVGLYWLIFSTQSRNSRLTNRP